MSDGWLALINVAAVAASIAGMGLVHLHNRREWRKLRHRGVSR